MKSKHATWTCRECEKRYVPAHKKFGSFIYLCDDCSYRSQFEDKDIDRDVGRTDRYVGRMTEKGNEGIEIFRTDIASHKKQIQLESKRGMAPNIMITSPVNQLVRDQERQQKELDKEVKKGGAMKEKEVPDPQAVCCCSCGETIGYEMCGANVNALTVYCHPNGCYEIYKNIQEERKEVTNEDRKKD